MRIAIIGSGGAGMTAAWLLDEDHDVTLFERSSELGGHACTTPVEIDGRVTYADEGFSWFSDAMYPTFMRLLEIHGVPTRIVPMTASFTQRRGDRTWLLPPVTPGAFLRTVADPPGVLNLLRLNRVISNGGRLVRAREYSLSWNQYLKRLKLPERFCREVLTPFVGGAWGAPLERVGEFSAYTLMKYFVVHRPVGLSRYPWHVIRDGAASYIGRVARSLRRTGIHTRTTITGLDRTPTGWRLTDNSNVHRDFDAIILATGARDAQEMLRATPGLDRTRRVLDRFEYYTAQVATHTDPTFMPSRRSDWGAANVVWDGTASRLTIWSGREERRDVFTSYIGDREPQGCRHVSRFKLPLMTTTHYEAIENLATVQGKDGLWFAGDWTHDVGCHEDAVVSAVNVAERLAPGSERLGTLRSPRAHPPMEALPDLAPALVPEPALAA